MTSISTPDILIICGRYTRPQGPRGARTRGRPTHARIARVRSAHEIEITQYAIDALSNVEGVTIYGPKDAHDKGGAVTFNYGDLHPHDLSQVLDAEGIAIRAGHHCAQPLMRRLGCVATARASFYLYNRKDEVDALVDGLGQAERIFGNAAAPARAGAG